MGLPARQRRALEGMEDKLRGSDPKLAAMFLIFGRLTRDEDMPRIEELRHRAAMLALRIRLFLRAVGRRPGRRDRRRAAAGTPRRRTAAAPRLGRARGWRPMAVFFPIALVLMSASIFIAARFGGTPRCPAPSAVATAKLNPRGKPLPKNARKCRVTGPTPVLIGR
jgi:hypothetical protein